MKSRYHNLSFPEFFPGFPHSFVRPSTHPLHLSHRTESSPTGTRLHSVDQSATSPRKRDEEPANFSLLLTNVVSLSASLTSHPIHYARLVIH